MSIFKLAFSNMRKRKGAAVTFLIMTLLAGLMLSVSLSLMIDGANFYETKVNELNAPHYRNDISLSYYKDEFLAYADGDGRVTETSVVDALGGTGDINRGSETVAANTVLLLHSETAAMQNSFFQPPVIDPAPQKTADSILLGLKFKSSGVRSGDKVRLAISNLSYEFTVCGFCEDPLYGYSTNSLTVAYLNDESYQEIQGDGNLLEIKSLLVRLKDPLSANEFSSDFLTASGLSGDGSFFSSSVHQSKANTMMFVNVMSIIMLLFSLILLVIAFIVAAFSIASGIAEDIATIGALKSVGYKNKILRTGQIVQYLLIALFGSAAGALISLAAFGFIGNIIAGTSGLLWTAGVNVLPLLFSILIVGALTALTGLLATGRFKKITPINALRGGDSHHSFKKNRMPLDKRPKMPLDLQLGFKRFFTGIKSNIVLAVVMSLLVFICTMVNAASYNLNDDQSVMINMIGLEMSELWIMSGPDTDIDAVNTRLNAYPEVTRTMLLGTVDGCKIDGVTTGLETAEDYTKFEINPFVRGGTPLEDDEIALCATQSGLTGKDVGDRVRVEYGGKTEEFRVSGIIQGLGNTETARITYSAMTKLFPDFKPDSIYTYLNDGVNTEAFISRLKNDFGNKIVILNTEKQVADVLASLGGPFAAITWVMVIVTVIVTAFMLFLMISTLIRKAKKEFGILKAIGFKTGRLILQLLISYLPALVLGAVAGVILGFTVTNPLFSVFFAGMNLPKTYFLTPVLPALGIGAGILAASALTIYLVGLRLRKISPQKLIREN